MEPRTETLSNRLDKTQEPAPRRNSFWCMFSDIFYVVRRDRKWLLLPLIIFLLILAALLAFAALMGPAAPFIYPLL